MKRVGERTIIFENKPTILSYGSVVGKKEHEGPLSSEFDTYTIDSFFGEKTFEKAESKLQKTAVQTALDKGGFKDSDIDNIFAGDLLNQCTGTTFGIRELGIPFAGVYGACSTMALSLAAAAVCVDSRIAETAAASTSSHFCSAEKQFRMPLEYGGQRTPTAQWTATAAGAAIVSGKESKIHIEKVIIGRIQDYGIKDPNNMGAAMAPAACRTIADFLNDTNTVPGDYDLILTGDLGAVGSELLCELMIKQENIDISAVQDDCGLILYDIVKQKEIGAGGSGCGCSGAVVCSDIFNKIENSELKRVLFVGTGALMSSVSSLQSESIPSVAHGVLLTGG